MGLFNFLFASGKLKALQEENNSLRLQNQDLRNKIYELEKELYYPSESSDSAPAVVPAALAEGSPQPDKAGAATPAASEASVSGASPAPVPGAFPPVPPQPGEAGAAPAAVPVASASGSPKVVRHGKIDRRYNEQLEGVGDPSCPLYKKVIRITGTFEQIGLTRDQVAKECQKRGAESAREGICKSMDILIMGNNAGPSKIQKVQEWRAQGLPIQVLNQLELKEIFDKFQA